MKYALWIAVAGSLILSAGCYLDDRMPAEMVSVSKNQPAAAEKSLEAEVRFDIGTLEVAGEKGPSIYSLDLDYDKANYEPDVQYQTLNGGAKGRLSFRLESSHKIRVRGERHQNRARLNLSNALPVELKLNSGVGETRLSLSGMKISRLDLEAGVGEARITLYEPNAVVCDSVRIKNGVGGMNAVGLANLNFRDFEFEGGVGGANLDFSGEWKQDASLRIQVGVGGVSVRMPRDVGVRVDAEKHFLSGLHLDGFSKRDSIYYSENYDKARIRVSFRVVTGVGGFRINWL